MKRGQSKSVQMNLLQQFPHHFVNTLLRKRSFARYCTLRKKGNLKGLPPVHPTIKRFAEIVSNPEKDEVTKNLLVLINDMMTNNGITKKKQRSDSSKSLCAFILDYGGPALSNQIGKRIGGHSLSTLHKIVRLPYLIPQRWQPSSFACAREFFNHLRVQSCLFWELKLPRLFHH